MSKRFDVLLFPLGALGLGFLFWLYILPESEVAISKTSVTSAVTQLGSILAAILSLFRIKEHISQGADGPGKAEVQSLEKIGSSQQQDRLENLQAQARRLKIENTALRQDFIRLHIARRVILVALIYAASFLPAALIQQVTYELGINPDALSGSDTPAPLVFIVQYLQSISLLVAASLIVAFTYHGFLSRHGSDNIAKHPRTIFAIGGLGLLVTGVVSFITLTPEQISTLSNSTSVPAFEIGYLSYLAIFRLAVLPVFGILVCFFIASIYSPKTVG